MERGTPAVMDRQSTKHGPHLDEAMARETEGLTHGSGAGSRAEEWRNPEPPADGEPGSSWAPEGYLDREEGGETDADRRDWRAKVGSYLHKDIYPADREKLLATARESNAPDDVLAALGGLPDGGSYANARELWGALGLRIDERF